MKVGTTNEWIMVHTPPDIKLFLIVFNTCICRDKDKKILSNSPKIWGFVPKCRFLSQNTRTDNKNYSSCVACCNFAAKSNGTISMEQKRIAALGDSLTRGVVLNEEKNRYSILDNSFIDIISETLGFDIKNYGKFGCTVDFGEQVIDRHAAEISASDYTFLEFGGNDCDFNWGKIADCPTDEHLPKTILDSFKEKFSKLIQRVRELGSKPIIISLPPIDSEYYFSFISRFMNGAQRENVFNWLGGDINVISRWHEMYNRALFEISRVMHTPIIDITTPFDKFQGAMRTLYCADGIHPNAEGHRLIAASIAGNRGFLA